MKRKSGDSNEAGERERLTPATRRMLSGLLLFHLLAVLSAPLAAQPSSELFGRMFWCFRPYLEALNFNNGYRFFAPEPGPSHLIRYELVMPDGRVRTGRFPDKEQHRPRLLYHRHFMLSEKVIGPPESWWVREWPRSYAAHLQAESGAKQVRLVLIEHLLAPRQLVVGEGVGLDDPRSYREVEIFPVDRRFESPPRSPPGPPPQRPADRPEEPEEEDVPPPPVEGKEAGAFPSRARTFVDGRSIRRENNSPRCLATRRILTLFSPCGRERMGDWRLGHGRDVSPTHLAGRLL